MNEQSQSFFSKILESQKISENSFLKRNYQLLVNKVEINERHAHDSQIFLKQKSQKQDKNNKTEINEKFQNLQAKQQLNTEMNPHKTLQNYLTQYMVYFQLNTKEFREFHQKNSNQLQKKLEKAGIKTCESYYSQFTILSIYQSRNFQVVELTVQMGYFKMDFTILNAIEQQLIVDQVPLFKFGGFGQIYLCNFRKQNYALKYVSLFRNSMSNYQSFKSSFLQILHQYFIARLFCALQIGPKIENIFGFDLLMNFKGIFFSMEICTSNEKFNVNQIKNNIKFIHSLRIIHKDIKPGNLMFSPFFKKWVFIDFGSVSFIKQDIGYRSFTKFYGTVKYSSQQMLILKQPNLSIKKWVDLYYNDMHCFKITQKQMSLEPQRLKNSTISYKENQQQQMIMELTNFKYYLIACKYLIWTNDISKLLFFIQNHELRKQEEFQYQVLSFLKEITPTQQLVYFYKNHLSFQSKDFEQFKILSFIYTNDFTFTYEYKSTQDKAKKKFTHFAKFYLDLSIQFEPSFVSKRKILTFQNIFQLYQRQKMTAKNYRSRIRNLQQIKKISKEQYYFEILDYMSFFENYYKSTLVQKVQACKIFFKSIGYEIQTEYKQKQDDSLEIILKTFYYLMNHGSQTLSTSNKFRFYISLLRNICIINSQLSYEEIMSHKSQWIQNFHFYQRFTIFWLFQQNITPQKQFQIFSAEDASYKTIMQKMDQSVQMVINLFQFNLQNNIQTQENVNTKNLRKEIFDFLIKKCQKRKLFQILDDFKGNKSIFNNINYRSYVQFVVSLFTCFRRCQKYYNGNVQKQNELSYFQILEFLRDRQSYKSISSVFKYNQLPIQINIMIIQAYQSRKLKRLSNLLKFADSIINCEEITMNSHLQKRLTLSYYNAENISEILNRIFNIDNQGFKTKYKKRQLLPYYYSELCKLLQTFKSQNVFSEIKPTNSIQASIRLIIKILNQKYKEIHPKVQKAIKDLLVQLNPHEVEINKRKFLTLKQLLNFFKMEFRVCTFSVSLINQQNGKSFLDQLINFFNQIKGKLLTVDSDSHFTQIYILIVNQMYCLPNKWVQAHRQLQFLQKVKPEMKNILNNLQKNQPVLQIYQVCYLIFSYFSKHFIYGERVQHNSQLIRFYIQVSKRSQMPFLYNSSFILLQIWLSLVVCEKTNNQKAQFIMTNIKFLNKNPVSSYIQVFNTSFNKIYLDEYGHNNKRLHDSVSFIDFLLKQIQKQEIKSLQDQNKYFSLIAYFCLFNNHLNLKTSKKLLMYIYKGIKSIKLEAKHIILQNLPQMLQKLKNQKRNKKLFLKRYSHIILKKIQKQKSKKQNMNFLQLYVKKIQKIHIINSK